MVTVALERIADLFAQAERESTGTLPELSDRYVALARRIGMRYNVRLLPEYQELYCRGCSRYWVEGRTVRTRLREGVRVRTCLGCGRRRRVRYPPRPPGGGAASLGSLRSSSFREVETVGTSEAPGGRPTPNDPPDAS